MTATAIALPNIDAAKLPAAYQAAKTALAQCARVDECREWADRMEALASYAKQSEDETLLKHVMRIKARAIDRCGEILREIPAATSRHEVTGGDAPIGRMQAAAAAGLSRDQTVVALRVNAVPRDLFEEMVESDNPPTITKLAQLGTKKRPEPVVIDDYLKGRDPADFEQAGQLIGLVNYAIERSQRINLDAACRGLNDRELGETLPKITTARQWLKDARDALQRR